ncbi:uncharacterized protein LOC100144872 isoform X2 [Strongylocentrotus purpuratus]|uniref:Uncharacterized protein n=1 Tax=Strongylocentrotus purpuratus TaxID=7668 RepID=A0A7M7PKV7_STRPU|nr:uncharacterized protein LOC100144872 isoform X2 [Strongylocentrotus purpuratus]XP_030851844.1 uncharacterized protein LOC100144872 isoform X2 [Strongylocentrotus purpuratus]
MRLPFFSGFLTTRKLVILLAWYAIVMVIAIFTFSHTRWKEESNLLRVYNSLFFVPSDVPLVRDSLPTRLPENIYRRNVTNRWENSSVWLPFDPDTGEFRYRYASRTHPQRTSRLDALKESLLRRTGNSSSLSTLVLIRNISNGRLLSETLNEDLWRENGKSRTRNESLAGVLQELVGDEVGDLLGEDKYNSYNSSMLLAAIERNMQKIRQETEISLKHLSHLTGILNGSMAGNGSSKEGDLSEKFKDRVQDDDDVLPGSLRIGVNQDRYAYEGRTKQGTGSAKGALSAKQSDRPSLLSVLIGKDLLEDNNKPKPAARASIIRELTKDASVNSTASSNSTSTPLSTETPEVDGYYRIDTRRKLRLQCSSCAVISSSGQLLNSSAGAQIDTYPCVLRMNSAPTSSYEKDVGSKTTVRVMGHVNLLKVNQSNTEQMEIFINKTTRTEMLVIPWLYTTRINKRRDKHYNIAKNFSKVYPDTEFYVLSSGKMISAESIFQRETGITRKDAKTWLSTGWMTLLFALDVCQKVDVFGLVPENYCRVHPNDTTPYHYYDTEFKSQCTYYKESEEHLTFGHLFVTEKAIFARWAMKFNINFLYPTWNLTISNSSGPLDTPFIKLFHEAQHNKTKQKTHRHRSFLGARIRPRKPPVIGPKTKEEAEKEKYQKLTHAIMFIVAIFLSLVVFLLLFLLCLHSQDELQFQ